MSHFNYHRRTSIDKFNNRPPFDIKKMDDATCTENKEQSVSFCNNCEKIYMNAAAKSYISVARYLGQFGDKCQIGNNKTKTVIPKIMESFQKAAPNKTAKRTPLKKQSESLETLFRNNKQCFGKIIPDHKLMKDLLKNFDEESSTGKPVSYQQIDMIPSKDTSPNLSEIEPTIRVDKATSTTGLRWPIIRNDADSGILSKHSKCDVVKTNSDRRLQLKIPQKKDPCKFVNHVPVKTKVDRKKSSGSSDLEYFPSKENSLKNPDPLSKIPLHSLKMASHLNKAAANKEFPNYKYNVNPEGFKKENTYVLYTNKSKTNDAKIETRKQEKSFVQLQVEKLNKRNGCKNARYKGKNSRLTDVLNKKKNMSKRYLALMNSVRDSLPKMEDASVSESLSENHEWSESTANSDTQVRFPKETRNAMEHLLKDFKRIPLTQYVKNHDFRIRPAISANCKSEYRECNVTPTAACLKKPSSIALQCSRNLSCQRTSRDGPRTRIETSLLPRYNNNSRLRTNTKGS